MAECLRYAIAEGCACYQHTTHNNKGWVISGPLLLCLSVICCVSIPAASFCLSVCTCVGSCDKRRVIEQLTLSLASCTTAASARWCICNTGARCWSTSTDDAGAQMTNCLLEVHLLWLDQPPKVRRKEGRASAWGCPSGRSVGWQHGIGANGSVFTSARHGLPVDHKSQLQLLSGR